MPIEYKKGDMFTTSDNCIAHGCNCKGVMGAGVAKIIKEKFPENFASYKKTCDSYNGTKWLLGKTLVHTENEIFIFNLFTQYLTAKPKLRRPVSYEAVATSFAEMFHHMRSAGLRRVSIPKIGAGLGGADWNVVECIISSEIANYPEITVTVWKI